MPGKECRFRNEEFPVLSIGSAIVVEEAMLRLRRATDARDPAKIISACRSIEMAIAGLSRGKPENATGLLEKCRELVTQSACMMMAQGRSKGENLTATHTARKAYTNVDRDQRLCI